METTGTGTKGFIAFMCFDVAVFFISVYIWTKYRTRIIWRIHTGFVNARLKRPKVRFFQNVTQAEIKCGSLFTQEPGAKQVAASRAGTLLSSRTSRVVPKKSVLHKAIKRGAQRFKKTISDPLKGRPAWWFYLIDGGDAKISNNEATLYLQFLWRVFVMLLTCSFFSLLVNGTVYIYLRANGRPYFILTHNVEDLFESDVTIWSLYLTTWLYSIILYLNVLSFRTLANKNQQVTVVLRPQLHTIMVFGFEKTVKDPTVLYRHFDRYFPNQVLAAHLILNHSKRLGLEEKLKNAKLQLCGIEERYNKGRDSLENSLEHTRGYDSDTCRDCNPIGKNILESNGESYSGEPLTHYGTCTHGQVRPATRTREPRRSASTNVEFKGKITAYAPSSASASDGSESFEASSHSRSNIVHNRRSFIKQSRYIRNLKSKIELERNKDKSSTRIAFVSFADYNVVMHIMRDRKILEAVPKWRISPAPHPRDIVWSNLHISRFYCLVRCIVLNVLLLIFYVAVTWILGSLNLLYKYKTHVTYVPSRSTAATAAAAAKAAAKTAKTAVKTATNLMKNVDAPTAATTAAAKETVVAATTTRVEVEHIAATGFWNSLVAPIAMAIINTCVHPPMINNVSFYIGFWKESTYQRYLLCSHIFYLIISTILVPLVASMLAFWKIFDGQFDSLSIELGDILVNTSWRFATVYVVNATFLGASNQLLQVSQILVRWFTQRIFKFDSGVIKFDFGYWYAFHISILTLVMLFAIFVPYLLLLGTAYFGIRFIIDRYNLTHDIWQIKMDSVGNVSASAIKSMLISISLTQFAMSGVFLTCQERLPTIYTMLLYITSAVGFQFSVAWILQATWLFIYESNADAMIKSTENIYSVRLKPLDHHMLNTIKVCYMHPCDAADLVNMKI